MFLGGKMDIKLLFLFVLFSAFLSDGELYSGTAYNFLGSEPIISRYSPSQSLLRTEYSTSWLNGELGQYVTCKHLPPQYKKAFTVADQLFSFPILPFYQYLSLPPLCFPCRTQFCFCRRDQGREKRSRWRGR